MTGDECAPTLVGQFLLIDYPGRDDVGPNGERPMPMSKDYRFDPSGTFRMDGYPPLEITGRYEVIATDAQRIRVRFTEVIFNGSSDEDEEKWIEFSDCGAQMVMDGMTYRRQSD